jgi:hypothetical protein
MTGLVILNFLSTIGVISPWPMVVPGDGDRIRPSRVLAGTGGSYIREQGLSDVVGIEPIKAATSHVTRRGTKAPFESPVDMGIISRSTNLVVQPLI